MSNTINTLNSITTQSQNNTSIDFKNNTGMTKKVHISSANLSQVLSNGSITVNGVSIELSDESIKALEEAQKAREEMLYKQEMQENMEAEKENAEAAKDAFTDQAKLLEIARRITRGDKVPPSDEKKLAEADSELYQIAKQASILNANKKHKKHDALFEDEDETTQEIDDTDSAQETIGTGVDIEVSIENLSEELSE